MPFKVKKTRWVKKGAKPTKGWRKTGAFRKKGGAMKKKVPDKIRYFGVLLPDRCRLQMHTSVQTAVADRTALRTFGYYGNSFGDGTAGTNGCGPQTDGAGQFGVNYPAGLKTFLQTPNNAGTVGMYSEYRIHGSKIKVQILPANITAAGVASKWIQATVFPSVDNNWASMSRTQVVEQPKTRTLYIPNNVPNEATGIVSQIAYPKPIFHGEITTRLEGVNRALIGDATYNNNYGAICGTPWYWIIFMQGDNGHYACNVQVDIYYDVEFFARNQLSTAVNL